MLDTFIMMTLAAGVLVFTWFLLTNTGGDDRETIVGVQRRGRTYFVRQDILDRLGSENYSYSGGREDRVYLTPWIVVAVSLVTVLTILGISRIG